MTRAGFLAFVLLLGIATDVSAHKPSDSYLNIDVRGDHLRIEWDISLRDLEMLVGLDTDGNGEITWRELKNRRVAVSAHAISRLKLTAGNNECLLEPVDLQVTRHSDGAYAVLVISTDCHAGASAIRVEYSLLFDRDPTHRGLIAFTRAAETQTFILQPGAAAVDIHREPPPMWTTLWGYLKQGIWHILKGFDHVLFLLCLLLTTVLTRAETHWRPVSAIGPVCRQSLKIVSVFTLAHSLTLWLSVMAYVVLPGRLVETVIVLSILVSALHNLYPATRVSSVNLAFVFGLIHGFGFANVLLDLGLASFALGLSLFGFNLGVELGQLAIVIVFLPVRFVDLHNVHRLHGANNAHRIHKVLDVHRVHGVRETPPTSLTAKSRKPCRS